MLYNRQPFNKPPPSEDLYISQKLSERLMGWAIPPSSYRFLRLSFNRQPFNRPIQTEDNVYISANLYENLSGWLNIGADYYIAQRLNENLRGKARLASGVKVQAALLEELAGNACAVVGIQVSQQLLEFLGGTGHMGADVFIARVLQDHMGGAAHLGANLYTGAVLLEEASGTAHMGANIFAAHSLYEVLNGYANARDLREYITNITQAIPAGATLVIDAGNFNVTLQQGKNITDVIHWHEGDWLWISRDTISFTLAGIGSNSYQWEVFYHALYL